MHIDLSKEVFENAARDFNVHCPEYPITGEQVAYACLLKFRQGSNEHFIDHDLYQKYKIDYIWAVRIASDRVFDVFKAKSVKSNYGLE